MSTLQPPDPPQPYFERPSVARGARGRLLLLSYHFPPSREVGALRWQKLAGFAAERGWAVDVIALDPGDLSEHDPERLAELPEGVRIFGVRAPVSRVHRIVSALLGARRRLLRVTMRPPAVAAPAGQTPTTVIPRKDSLSWSEIRRVPRTPREMSRAYTAWLDFAMMGRWAREVAKKATLLAAAADYDAVITCGPPHMVHEAGRLVAERTGLPLVLDFRDPWSLVERVPEVFASPGWRRRARSFEHAALSRASLVVVNTEPHRRALQHAYPALGAPIIAVTNGYDEEVLPVSRHGRRFVIAYAGAIYLDRDPRPLLQAAAHVIRDLALAPEDFGLAFMGSGSFGGVSLRDMARAEAVDAYLEVRPSAPRRDALEFLAGATMLVSLPQDSEMAIPSKLFEYMQYHAWLLALAAPGSATALLLEDSPADVVRREDVGRIVDILRLRYEQHARGIVPPRIADDPRFSRRRQAQVLFDAMERVLGAPPATRQPSAIRAV